jgi:hypothetical protein
VNKFNYFSIPLRKVTTNDRYASILINSIFDYYGNDGRMSLNPYTGSQGFEFPKGSGGDIHCLCRDVRSRITKILKLAVIPDE